ncbi:MAG: DMT family transporter [Paracoccaceae bacterium]
MSQLPALLAPALRVIVLGGIALAVQAPLNGALGRMLGAGLPAATVSFAVVLVAAGLVLSRLQGFDGRFNR